MNDEPLDDLLSGMSDDDRQELLDELADALDPLDDEISDLLDGVPDILDVPPADVVQAAALAQPPRPVVVLGQGGGRGARPRGARPRGGARPVARPVARRPVPTPRSRSAGKRSPTITPAAFRSRRPTEDTSGTIGVPGGNAAFARERLDLADVVRFNRRNRSTR